MKMIKLNKTMNELGLASTAYGLPNLIRAKHFASKLLWITFIIFSSILSCYYVSTSILTYNEYKIVTVIESVYEQPAQFPTISFCSNKFYSFGFDPLSQLIQPNKCSFRYDYSCSKNPRNYFEMYYGWYGICYRFNSGKNKTGHSIPIENSYIGGKDDAFALDIYAPDGLEIWIHNTSSPPKLDLYNNHNGDLIFASAASETLIVIDKTNDEKLGLPYNNCFKDVSKFPLNKTIIDYIQERNESYSHNNCLELCFDLKYILDNPCNCTKASLGNVWEQCWRTIEKCNKEGCTFQYKENFYKESILGKCSEYCPIECDTVKFSVSVSSVTKKIDLNLTSIRV